jgi:GntR family transcriptional regulator
MIDRNSPIPFYAQLKSEILARIEGNIWKPGEQLPGELDLCSSFSVSRTVVRQALQELEIEGVIRREKGKGTFVAAAKITEALAYKLTGFYQDMSEQGLNPVSKMLRREVLPASPKLAGELRIDPGESVIEIERLRFVGDDPLVYVTNYLPYKLCPGLEMVDLSRQSLYWVLERHYGIVIASGRRTMEAVGANSREAELLRVPAGTPLMLLDSIGFLDNGQPVEIFHALHRGDRSRFEVLLTRQLPTAGL